MKNRNGTRLISVGGIFVLLTGIHGLAQTNSTTPRRLPPPPPLPIRTNFSALTNRPRPFIPAARTNLSPAARPAPVVVQSAQPKATIIQVNPPGPVTQPVQVKPVTPAPVVVAPPPPNTPPTALVFDAESKSYAAKAGDPSAPFTFHLTNVWTGEVLVNSVRTSCGCTVASLPSQPWRLAPGTNGPIGVTVNLAGKRGTITKSVTVDTSSGVKSLLVSVTIPEPTNATPSALSATGTPVDADRQRNMLKAMADRQVVFKGECASCHAEPAKGKMGRELYAAACTICHESPQRASSVPDLRALNHPTTAELRRMWIASGKPGSMMPAFSDKEGGPLTEAQINSLVEYMAQAIPMTAQTTVMVKTNAAANIPAALPAPKAN